MTSKLISDSDTNVLYLADSLQKLQPVFYEQFKKVLHERNIQFRLLPNTKDIWAVDYMPVQIKIDKFIQFTYQPDYLQSPKEQETISDVDAICLAIDLPSQKSELIVDGGNVVKWANKVIMCDKVFHENKHLREKQLIKQLESIFDVDQVIFVPWDEYDFTGHADGMVRFIDDKTVLVNSYPAKDRIFQTSLRISLHNAGLNWVEMPYDPPKNSKSISAKGLYLNYLQMEEVIIMPSFGSQCDDKAIKVLEDAFPTYTIESVNCKDLAEEGGLLNCITWNILV